MEEKKIVILKLSGGISYDREISEALAVQIITLCVRGNDASHEVEPDNTRFSVKESATEYIIRVGAKRIPDKILALASYLREHQQKNSISPAELKLMFRDAGESLPANFTRDFNDTTASGWLAAEPQKKGYFYVTRTGLDIISKGFDKAQVRRAKISKKNVSEVKKTSTA